MKNLVNPLNQIIPIAIGTVQIIEKIYSHPKSIIFLLGRKTGDRGLYCFWKRSFGIVFAERHTTIAARRRKLNCGFYLKPNPANDKVEISLMQDEEGICTIRISDLLGHPVLTKSFDCKLKQTILDVRTLVAGMYIIEVQKNNVWSKTEKLIISR